ncbi:MAG TPA: DUF4387 domain-containing protein [Xanthobacteraceae bacterium]
MATLGDLAKLVRSKNAGPFWLTIDIMFDDAEAYRRACDAEIINRGAIARLYSRNPADIIVVNHDTALAIKVSFPRPQSSGSKEDSDVYGGQQYAPLLGCKCQIDVLSQYAFTAASAGVKWGSALSEPRRYVRGFTS